MHVQPFRPFGLHSLRKPALTALRALPCVAVLLLLASTASAQQEKDWFADAVAQGPLMMAAVAFAGGLLVNLTPCVYPMIAITVSVFGARQATTRREALLLSTCYVMGIVFLFTTMLMAAALTGSVFGTALSKPPVVIGISVVFLALAASSFGAFEMTLPSSVTQRLSTVGGVGYVGAFILGLVSSLIAAPCVGPVLTSILIWIGKTQNVGLGALVGSMFALGIGLPTWVVGTFAVSLPKAGKWMLWVKSFFGIVLVVVALHFLNNVFPAMASVARPGTVFLVGMAVLIVAGLLAGAVHLAWEDGGVGLKLRKAVGIAMCVAGGFLLWAGWETPDVPPMAAQSGDTAERLLTWGHSEQAARASAQAEKRPLLVDFTAEWCAACKELAKKTFADPRVMKTAAHFVAVKVDATNEEDPQVEAIMKKYEVRGLPTVVIIDSSGQERKRFTDFVEPEKFLAAIEGIH